MQILKLVSKRKPKLTVPFFHTDGTILIQGVWFQQWAINDYPRIIHELESRINGESDVHHMQVLDRNGSIEGQLTDEVSDETIMEAVEFCSGSMINATQNSQIT